VVTEGSAARVLGDLDGPPVIAKTGTAEYGTAKPPKTPAWMIAAQGDPTGGLLAVFVLPPRDVWLGVALMIAMGTLAGATPAVGAMRLKITDALRRN
jgi:ABC-type antimicrobial peptide transport system permease subunit